MRLCGLLNSALLSLLLMAAFLLTACSGEPPAKRYKDVGLSTDAVPLIEGGYYGTLENGLRYYILENKKYHDTAFAYLAVNVGSADEKDTQLGYANFVRTILAESGVNNSSSSLDYTFFDFSAAVYADTDDGIKKVSDIIFTRINSVINAPSFTNEKTGSARDKILANIKNTSIETKIDIKKNSFFYAGSIAENRVNVLGQSDLIEKARTADIDRFYRTWYRPDNMAIIFIGDFNGAELEQSLLTKTKITIPAGRKPFDRTVYELPVPQKKSTIMEVYTDSNAPQTTITFFYKMKQERYKNNLQGLRTQIDEAIITNMLTRRFRAMLSDAEDTIFAQTMNLPKLRKNFPFSNIGLYHNKVGKASQYFTIRFIPKKDSADLAIITMLHEIKSLVKTGFTDTEVNRFKNQYLLDLQNAVQHSAEQSEPSYLKQMLFQNYMHNECITSVDYQLKIAEKLIPQITKEELNKVLRDALNCGDLRIFASSKPEDAPKITLSQIGDMLK
ncbi:MAG: hypothetical protein Ta2B_04210 [Termitinemataceae bacterium]|nr:MAG: hypothetical protein Ta2B_04210 [Termitinemataceae bacterium]